MVDLNEYIRDIPDFPKPGIMFKDITPLLRDPVAFRASIDGLDERFAGVAYDRIVGVESRGFLFGAALALKRGVSFVPVRKPGKLPYESVSVTYELEYGTDAMEIHKDAIEPGDRVLIIDDLLATGGTAGASAKLVEKLNGEVVGYGFVVELGFLNGREKIKDYRVESLLVY